MAKAFLLSPLPAIVTAVAGTIEIGPASNVLNDFAGVAARISCTEANVSAQIELDLGMMTPIDTVMIFGVDLFPTSFPDAGIVYITARDAAGALVSAGTVPAYAGGGRAGSGGVCIWSLPAPVIARSLRIHFNAAVAGQRVQLSRILVGRRFTPERNFRFGAGFGVKDLGKVDFSRLGVPLRTRGAKLRTTSLTFSSLKRDEVEGYTRPLLERIGNTDFLAIVTDPTIVADLPNRCYYGPLVGDNPGHVWRNAAGWEATFNLVSAF